MESWRVLILSSLVVVMAIACGDDGDDGDDDSSDPLPQGGLSDDSMSSPGADDAPDEWAREMEQHAEELRRETEKLEQQMEGVQERIEEAQRQIEESEAGANRAEVERELEEVRALQQEQLETMDELRRKRRGDERAGEDHERDDEVECDSDDPLCGL